MNSNNIGKFIAELRKEKKMTQDELGEELGISGKTISKWECGINVPDFSNIERLSSFFQVSIFEIFNGKRLDNSDIQKMNKNTANSFKFYLNGIKNKYIKILSSVIILALILLIAIFFLNNFNKNKVYSISSTNNDYSVSGYLIFNQKQNLVIINNINYQGEKVGTIDEPLITYLKITLYIDNDTIISYEGNNNVEDNSETKLLSSALSTISLSAIEDKDSNKNLITNDKKIKNPYLQIDYIDDDNQENTIKIDLKLDKMFSNNKLFY